MQTEKAYKLGDLIHLALENRFQHFFSLITGKKNDDPEMIEYQKKYDMALEAINSLDDGHSKLNQEGDSDIE